MSPHYNSHIEAETATASFESKDIAERKNSLLSLGFLNTFVRNISPKNQISNSKHLLHLRNQWFLLLVPPILI